MRDRSIQRLKPEVITNSEIQNRAEQLTFDYAEQVAP